MLVLHEYVPFEEAVDRLPHVKYVVFPSTGEPRTWMVQAAAKALGSHETRHPLPEAWAALRGPELDAVTGGLPGAVFCHKDRWIAGHAERAGAIGLAWRAVATD